MATIEQLTERVQELEIALDQMKIFNVPQRLVCALLKLGKEKGQTFTLPHTKTVLAGHVSIEIETLSRAIPRLPEYGVMINGKTVTFQEPKITAQKVCAHCAGRWTCKAAAGR